MTPEIEAALKKYQDSAVNAHKKLVKELFELTGGQEADKKSRMGEALKREIQARFLAVSLESVPDLRESFLEFRTLRPSDPSADRTAFLEAFGPWLQQVGLGYHWALERLETILMNLNIGLSEKQAYWMKYGFSWSSSFHKPDFKFEHEGFSVVVHGGDGGAERFTEELFEAVASHAWAQVLEARILGYSMEKLGGPGKTTLHDRLCWVALSYFDDKNSEDLANDMQARGIELTNGYINKEIKKLSAQIGLPDEDRRKSNQVEQD